MSLKGKRPTNEELIIIINKNHGLVKQTAETIGVSRLTMYNWINSDPELQRAVNDARESMKDIAESKLFKLIEKNNPRSIEYYLNCMAKDRGYAHRVDVTTMGETVNPYASVPDAILQKRVAEQMRAFIEDDDE